MQIDQQFVQVGERRVFVRHAGHGPAVVLLHQSPQNGRSMLPWLERLAPHYAVFAPDTPGFGASDPLPLAQPTIPDFARALARLLDALGLDRVLLYGVHTGAVVAARLALERPERVAALVCDGLALFNADERCVLLDGYLPPFEPAWDGAHLLWLWARLREQNYFFPWQLHDAAHRLAYPMPSAEKLHADVLDVLAAGDGYRVGYRAPFLYEPGIAAAAALRVPARLLYCDSDVLAAHLPRLGALPEGVCAQRVTVDELPVHTLAHFAAHAAASSTVHAAHQVDQARSAERCVGATPHGLLGLRIEQPQHEQVEVVLPDIGTAASLVPAGTTDRCRIVVDLPGHGASSGWVSQDMDAESLAAAIEAAVYAVRPEATTLHLRGYGGSAAFALRLAQRLGPRCASLTLHAALALQTDERERFLASLPGTTPDAQGSHLIAAWNWARQRALFMPWAAPEHAALAHSGAASPWRLHADVAEMLRAGELLAALWRAAFAVDVRTTSASLSCPVVVAA